MMDHYFAIGQAYGHAVVAAHAMEPAEIAEELRSALHSAETGNDPATCYGMVAAFGIELANRVDDGAFTPKEMQRLMLLKTRVQRGDIADVPPNA